ncbi:MAG: DNA repair protein RadA [Dehalococcoidia bacterium]
MAKLQTRTFYTCRECGGESPRWEGRCPHCMEWNTLEEVTQKARSSGARSPQVLSRAPQELASMAVGEIPRLLLPSAEFNRVLGGGIVPGSLILIGGEPGIGKSTLLLQSVASLADDGGPILYASGEESEEQIKLRASRLELEGRGLYIHAANDLDAILHHMEQLNPHLAVIDSIQTVYLEDSTSMPGAIGQVREATWRLMEWSKATNVPVFITGHVTKEGAIAGPRLLEHMVDVVLYLEGEPYSPYRLLRGVKNRYGSTNEVGIFEMRDDGLQDVPDPSRALLSERMSGAVGSAIVPTLEGTRPLMVEIQALTSVTSFNLPRRTANGVEQNRLLLVTAILSKRLGLPLANQDVIVNVIGGLRVNEPAADLGIALAIVSSLKSAPLDPSLVAIGELGLSGEIRSVGQMERRLQESAKMGFQRGIIPTSAARSLKAPEGFELVKLRMLSDAVKSALTKSKRPARGSGR